MSGEPGPAVARAASTILILRDGPAGLETFMVVRHHEIDFASGALVFPGGRLEPADAELARQSALFDDGIDADSAGLADRRDSRGVRGMRRAAG